ncbi:hypothetical protein [Phyllobacterium sophorae]|uniref:Major facilitator superfamily (MFS) profile domain-containing protein n=1 Tax=Phyllobacterium sophorae TaxID=1520277 RepID=A0A2P7B6L9_9HYPH|nr:hypothetical protein [Phyllobacterium sophorae]PSH62117.1 hypothetical protein CU103_19935 [Phyllobacterium sophorae]
MTIAGGAVISTAILALMPISPTLKPMILVTLCVQGFFLLGAQGSLYALATHIYPTTVRSTGVGSAASFGRLGAIASAYVGSLSLGFGSSVFFSVIAVSLMIALMAVTVVSNHAPSVARAGPRNSPTPANY